MGQDVSLYSKWSSKLKWFKSDSMNRKSYRHTDALTDLTEINTYMYPHTQMVNMEKHSLIAIHFDNFQYYGGGLYMIQK